jgi:hypothetical protein
VSTGGVGHVHRFDPVSGWCGSCNLRDDNKLIGKGGEILRPGREYTPDELDHYRQKANAR